MIKRYLVFGGYNYYPSGGWDDFIDSFDDVSEAQACVLKSNVEWWQVVDTHDNTTFEGYNK